MAVGFGLSVAPIWVMVQSGAKTPLFSACDGATIEAPSANRPAESELRHMARVPVFLRPESRSTSEAQHYVAHPGWGRIPATK
jgi:hypothetical protein